MIWKLFKWLYLLISGLSFILILCLFAFCGYIYIAEDEVKEFVEDFNEYRAFRQNDKIFEVIDVENDVTTLYSMDSNDINNRLSKSEDPKIKIKTKLGYAYLRPSQIYYIMSGHDSHIIITINGKKILLNKRETPLKKISKILNNYSCFYSTKSHIVNCLYIEQIKRETKYKPYKTFIILENEEEIPLPDSHVQDVLKLLDDIHQ